MKDELFQELLESVKQGAAIMKGELQPSRTSAFACSRLASEALLDISREHSSTTDRPARTA
jgi:hypothetical protein